MLLLLLLFEDFADLQFRHRVISAYKAWEVKRARLLTMVRVVVGLIGVILEGDMSSKIPPMSKQWTWR